MLCRGPGVVPRRVFCVDAPSAQASMGIQQYSKPLSPLLHWALCCLSFNIPLAMGENFADSLAQHPVDTPSPSGKAAPAPTPASLSIDASCTLTPICARHTSVVSPPPLEQSRPFLSTFTHTLSIVAHTALHRLCLQRSPLAFVANGKHTCGISTLSVSERASILPDKVVSG